MCAYHIFMHMCICASYVHMISLSYVCLYAFHWFSYGTLALSRYCWEVKRETQALSMNNIKKLTDERFHSEQHIKSHVQLAFPNNN